MEPDHSLSRAKSKNLARGSGSIHDRTFGGISRIGTFGGLMAIAAHWMISDNFGDRLTPWLIENIRGERPTWVSQTFDAEYYVASGSILNLANEHAKEWGAGLASFNDNVNDRAQIYAVRGPLTRAKALASRAKCPAVYGDPAILLPMFLPKKIEKIHDIGLIPHYVDQFREIGRAHV